MNNQNPPSSMSITLTVKDLKLTTDTPRLMDKEAQAKWFDEICQALASGQDDGTKAVLSIERAYTTGYITLEDKLYWQSCIHPMYKKDPILFRGYVLLQAGLSNFEAIKRMLSFMIACEPIVHKKRHIYFQNLLDDPPDDLTLPLLRWQIFTWCDGYAGSKGLELGWRNDSLIFGLQEDFDD